ncbi:acetoacetate decarboxylase family protein [Streptomyces chryseus]|uniref:acetoacetate decarboxylase family protein n=1 Tax=Streptomyces chryseus TaxID=68186 RepID=UPI0027E4FF0D|nr:acetoacetate decarboxylase family protein [Streptomyces chryseus]
MQGDHGSRVPARAVAAAGRHVRIPVVAACAFLAPVAAASRGAASGGRGSRTAVAAWVDDEQSLAGGRALWGIPKELGSLTVAGPAQPAAREAGQVRLGLSTGSPRHATVAARGAYRDLMRLRGRIRGRGRLVQRHDSGETHQVPLRVTGSPALGRVRLAADSTGPLAVVSGRRPFLTVSLRDFRFVVGRTGQACDRADT